MSENKEKETTEESYIGNLFKELLNLIVAILILGVFGALVYAGFLAYENKTEIEAKFSAISGKGITDDNSGIVKFTFDSPATYQELLKIWRKKNPKRFSKITQSTNFGGVVIITYTPEQSSAPKN